VKHTALFAAFILVFSLPAEPLQAQDTEDTDWLSLGIGYYDIADNDSAADFRLEYRDGHKYFWEIKPWAGLEVTSDSSVWIGGGILADLEVSPGLYVIPSFGAGFYEEGSSGKDLGYFIEFRSQLEVAYELQNKQRVGVSFGHISNADLDDKNPGTQVLNLYYHVPIDGLF